MTDPIWLGTWASLLAGLATALGSVPVLFGRRIPDRGRDTLLGVAAGVMLAATFFSLIQPAIALVSERYGSRLAAAALVSAGLAGGALLVWLLEQALANVYRWNGGKTPGRLPIDSVWVFVAAVTLHNVPEGMAVGVGFGAGDGASGTAIAVGIGLQNMPEGLAVALALVAHGHSRWKAFVIAGLTGLIEAPAGFIGAAAVALAQPLLPWALALAAGAMLFVIVQELIPESHRHGYRDEATVGLVAGFIVMLMLDVVFS
jgi:ZIP family zinc transporter